MGGKGSAPDAPTAYQSPATPTADEMAIPGLEEMMSMMSAMMTLSQQQQQQIQTLSTPDIASPEVIKTEVKDWSDEYKRLASKTKADTAKKQRLRKGREDTILTSPLSEEDERNAVLGG